MPNLIDALFAALMLMTTPLSAAQQQPSAEFIATIELMHAESQSHELYCESDLDHANKIFKDLQKLAPADWQDWLLQVVIDQNQQYPPVTRGYALILFSDIAPLEPEQRLAGLMRMMQSQSMSQRMNVYDATLLYNVRGSLLQFSSKSLAPFFTYYLTSYNQLIQAGDYQLKLLPLLEKSAGALPDYEKIIHTTIEFTIEHLNAKVKHELVESLLQIKTLTVAEFNFLNLMIEHEPHSNTSQLALSVLAQAQPATFYDTAAQGALKNQLAISDQRLLVLLNTGDKNMRRAAVNAIAYHRDSAYAMNALKLILSDNTLRDLWVTAAYKLYHRWPDTTWVTDAIATVILETPATDIACQLAYVVVNNAAIVPEAVINYLETLRTAADTSNDNQNLILKILTLYRKKLSIDDESR